MHASTLRSFVRALVFGLAAQALLAATLGAQRGVSGSTAENRFSGLHRGGVDSLPRGGRFSLDLGVGLAGADGPGDARLLLVITPRIRLLERAHGRLTLALPLLAVAGAQPTARDLRSEAGLVLDAQGLEAGPSFVFAPSLEWTFRPGCCLRPSVSIGAGVRHDRGRTEPVRFGRNVAETIDLRVDDVTDPVLTLGFALERPVARRLAFRFEARGLITFYGDTEVRDRGDFRVAELDDETVTSLFATLGVHIVF